MLDRQPTAPIAPLSRQRFLSSVAGVLNELTGLLLSSADPIAADTGAQIAQLLRVIREGAAARDLEDIAHSAVNIETYLMSGEIYGAGGDGRNVVLGSMIKELMTRVADAELAERSACDHDQRVMSPPSAGMDRRAP